MKSLKTYILSIACALVLALPSVAMATTEVTSGTNMTFTSGVYNGNSSLIKIDTNASAMIGATTSGTTFENNSAINIESAGSTTINNAYFYNDSGYLVDVTGGVTNVYGSTFNSTTGFDFDVSGSGVVNVYGNFGTNNNKTFTASNQAGFSGVLQNDTSSESYSFTDLISGTGVIHLLPAVPVSTPEPSSLTVFSIAGLALAGFAFMRRRARA